MSVSVCLSVCLCVCLSVRDHIFGTTRPSFTTVEVAASKDHFEDLVRSVQCAVVMCICCFRRVQHLHARGGGGHAERRYRGTFTRQDRDDRQPERIHDGIVHRHEGRSVSLHC